MCTHCNDITTLPSLSATADHPRRAQPPVHQVRRLWPDVADRDPVWRDPVRRDPVQRRRRIDTGSRFQPRGCRDDSLPDSERDERDGERCVVSDWTELARERGRHVTPRVSVREWISAITDGDRSRPACAGQAWRGRTAVRDVAGRALPVVSRTGAPGSGAMPALRRTAGNGGNRASAQCTCVCLRHAAAVAGLGGGVRVSAGGYDPGRPLVCARTSEGATHGWDESGVGGDDPWFRQTGDVASLMRQEYINT